MLDASHSVLQGHRMIKAVTTDRPEFRTWFSHNPSEWLTSVLSVHLWNGDTNAFLMGFCEEQIRCSCKTLGDASSLFSRHARQTKRSKCPPNNLSLRLISPWYDKHLILVKRSLRSGFPFMQRLKDTRVTQVQLLFRLPKGGRGMLRTFVPLRPPPLSSFYRLTEGRTLFQGLPTAKMNGRAPKKQPQAAHGLGGVVEVLPAQSWGSRVIHFDASLECIVCSDLKWCFWRISMFTV